MYRNTLPLVLLALGCEVQGLDVGGDGVAGTGGSAGAGGTSAVENGGSPNSEEGNAGETQVPTPPTPSCATDPELAEFVGVWEGSVQDFSFQALQPVRIGINGASRSGGICGTVLYGESNPPPAPTDPDAYYPPPAWEATSRQILAGFTYMIAQGGAQDSTLNVGVNGSEVWKPWCEMQSPVFDPNGDAYPSCIETLAGMIDENAGTCTLTSNEGPIVHPLAKCSLCGRGSVCACSADGCTSNTKTIQRSFTLGERDGTPTLTDSSNEPDSITILERAP